MIADRTQRIMAVSVFLVACLTLVPSDQVGAAKKTCDLRDDAARLLEVGGSGGGGAEAAGD